MEMLYCLVYHIKASCNFQMVQNTLARASTKDRKCGCVTPILHSMELTNV